MTTDNMTGTAHGVNLLLEMAYDSGYQAALASPEVRKLVDALRKAQEQFDREDSYATCDVAEDGRCTACKATYRMNRGKGNTGWKMQHDEDCAWVVIDQALQPFTQKKEG